jgi:hypothetical protein
MVGGLIGGLDLTAVAVVLADAVAAAAFASRARSLTKSSVVPVVLIAVGGISSSVSVS